MPKAVLYARFSSDNQRDESIDAQLRAMTKFCQDNEVVMVGEYVDRAKSATTDDRPEFLRMISDAEQKNFNIVLVHKLDRFARNRFDSSNYRNKLKKQNVSLVSVLENLDDSPESIIMESLLDGMAEYYSKNLAREVRKGHNENALQCKHNGGRPPFGFKVNPETQCYEIDENEAEAVRYIFNSISEGKSYNAVIADLNTKGFRTRSGNLFGKNSLYDMLHNEKYKGVYIYNRRAAKDADGKFNSRLNKFDDEIIRIEGGMPRIIDDELFESVNKIITSRKRLKSYGGSTQKYLLTG
ncbi:MAG: recombinase family protein, partial [Oscillospiraceae bacterium]|nr:recombinase family protein [Oscillospiraceae bacterium]